MADKDDGAAVTLPMRRVLGGQEVVAAGRAENVLQVPSPIYTATFVDAHHVLIGAGGGGRRFGMPNIATLLRVQSLSSSSSSSSPSAAGAAMSKKSAALASAAPAPPVWRFAAAVDLGPDDIPWCTTPFLPFDGRRESDTHKSRGGVSTEPAALDWSEGQRRVLDGLVGFVALSSITAFSLLGVYRGAEPSTGDGAESASAPSSSAATDDRRYLRQLARIEVPSDAKNPDKKPIALVQNLVVVSHDDNGVLLFALTDLVPDSFEDDDVAAYQATYADQISGAGATLQRRVPRTRTAAAPVAAWQLPARVNDLSANRVCIVQADVSNGASPLSPSQPCKAHLQEYLVVAAVLLDKTVVLSSTRLRRRYTNPRSRKASKKGDAVGADALPTAHTQEAAAVMTTALTLTGETLPLPFKLLTSSLRLVRLFGWGDIDAAQQADMRRRLTWQSLQDGGAATHGPLCSVLIVAYDAASNRSFLIHGAIDVTPAEAAASGDGDGGHALGLKVQWARRDPAPVLSDAITSLAVCMGDEPVGYAARVLANPLGATVPAHWIAGTVEGWVASLRLLDDPAPSPPALPPRQHWHADQIRPSPQKSVARRFPALHKEPVSCVAVSAEHDVVSADIAQNVALTTLPFTAPSASSSSAAAGVGDAAPQARSTSSSSLFPPPRAGGGALLGSLTDSLTNGPVPLRVVWFLLIPLVLALVGIITTMR
ncbi:hypothetical protein NESM_000057400 [Novymonas esmeraldas]|uniref:Uncharacterized protein n=1 Tax=Novymonas esmeraldas TaxID=1808958 RepID=A0AAW0F114_9TRYP